MAINKIEIQNSIGDIYYPHTSSDVVKHGSSTLSAFLTLLENKFKSYLPLSGGTLSSDLIINKSNAGLTLSGYGSNFYKFTHSSEHDILVITYNNSTIIAFHKNGSLIPINPNATLGDGGVAFKEAWVDAMKVSSISARNGNVIVGSHLITSGGWVNLGHGVDSGFGDAYLKRGAINGSDISLKENIKEVNIDRINLTTKNKIETEVTIEDMYNYVKDTSIKTFNYKGTEENIVGSIANEIPDNIYNKIGIVAETGERMVISSSQIAMLQGVLSMSINKIESLEEKIKLLEKKIDMLVA